MNKVKKRKKIAIAIKKCIKTCISTRISIQQFSLIYNKNNDPLNFQKKVIII